MRHVPDVVDPVDPVDLLEAEASRLYAEGDLDAAVDAWERAHEERLAAGQSAAAAWAAMMVALHLLVDSGLMSPVRGWLVRAERLAADPLDPVHAMIAAVRTYERFFCGDAAAARRESARALDLGSRLGVLPAVVIARTASARLDVSEGRVEEGLALLDELAVELVSPALDAMAAGMMLCEIVCCAQSLGRPELAREWTEVFDRWRRDRAFGGLHGRCRVHRAELLRWSGPAAAAEAEAAAAVEALSPWMRRELGWPLVELGTIRLQLGDLAGAEEALLGAHARAWCPQPSLARLRLAQGRVEEALDMALDAVDHPLPIPSKERPPFDDLRVAPLLEGLAEVAHAAGRPDLVASAAARLGVIAATYGGPTLLASAAVARCRSLLAADQPAVEAASAAVVLCADAGAAYEVAVARDLLADAHRAAGHEAAAVMERAAADAAYTAFGGRRLSSWQGTRTARVTAGRFAPAGDRRVVGLGGPECPVADLKGLRYIALLLARPGQEVHVLDLVAAESGSPRLDEPGLPVLDEETRAVYRRRLAEVEADLEEARRSADLGREELAERDREYLLAELSQAVGLGGRARTTGGSSERARTAVARSIRYALARLAEQAPDVAGHLEAAVVTGTWCRYRPDPLAPVEWALS